MNIANVPKVVWQGQMGDLLARSGFPLRSATRADCAHCSGGSNGTVSYTSELAHCFRCGWGANAKGLARKLGLLTETAITPEDRRERESLRRDAEALLEIEKAAWLEQGDEMLRIEAIRRNAGQRLDAIHRGEKERWTGEAETAWAALTEVSRQMPRAAAAYNVISFAPHKDRLAFVIDSQAREFLVCQALEWGYVADERGYRFEVQL